MTPVASASHPGTIRRPTSPGAPRRVSGPVRPAARPAPRPQPRTRSAPPSVRRATLGERALAFAKALPDHQLLDRIVRGRAWIPLLGVLLAGIVAMQVEVLKLGAGIGRSIEQGTELQSQNELLRANVAMLADDQRIESLAFRMGMVMPTPEAINFLVLRPLGYVQRALSSIHQPDAAGFVASLPASDTASATTSASAATSTPAGPGTSTTTPTSTSTPSSPASGG